MGSSVDKRDRGAFEAVETLLEDSPPILVEVRFPRAGTSPDWYLCQDMDEFLEAMGRLGKGAEVHISSVWDLVNTKQELIFQIESTEDDGDGSRKGEVKKGQGLLE